MTAEIGVRPNSDFAHVYRRPKSCSGSGAREAARSSDISPLGGDISLPLVCLALLWQMRLDAGEPGCLAG